MTDTSLHTKYRPKRLDKVLGQEDIARSLGKALSAGRSKSFLFSGPSGVGKTTLARIAAKRLVGDNCGASNILEIDAATNTGIDACRELTLNLRYRALGASPIKVIIMDECHKLSSNAWDSLLKSVEEPPAHVYWMFCTTNLSKVPSTIKTRCLHYALSPISEDDLLTLIKTIKKKEKLKTKKNVLEVIAENSDGSPRQALVNLEACKNCKNAAEALRIIKNIGDPQEIIDFCRFLLKERGRTWAKAVSLMQQLKSMEAESCRIVIVNYLSVVILNTKEEGKATELLGVLECFSEPYNQSDKFAPFVISVADALGLGK